MPYDLSRFSTQSFERFTQALAMAQFGNGAQVYGAGSDGARELTFEGRCVPVPDAPEWNGYVVLQSKFRQFPQGGKDDLKWLKGQADRELQKFLNPSRSLKAPEYYVLATNLRLTAGAADSSGARAGTLDLMLKHLDGWKKDLGVKGVWLWDADALSALLDVHAGVRTSYTSWIAPGDVLHAAFEHFAKPKFEDVVKRVVRDELKDQRGIKTQDSAQSHGRAVYIDEVFVDLPVDPLSTLILDEEAPHEDQGHEEDTTGHDEEEEWLVEDETSPEHSSTWNFVNLVADRLADNLSPSAWGEKGRGQHQKIVVLGGPGQGKSTIGQFLAQLLRANLVASATDVLPEIRAIANETIERAKAERINVSGPLRFPIHIALPRYADAISKEATPVSLLRYIATGIGRVADEEVDPATLREWLTHYPSLIILDGLDEVPRSGNRADVIRSIGRLMSDLREADADTLVLITSRPQGYLNDLDHRYWSHWHLSDLDSANAVRFASRLAEVLITQESRRHEVVATLASASEDPSTAPLMISPLQVSLLFSLVVTRSDIPKDRWTLFERHYETLRDREIAKGGSSGELIRRFRAEIDRLHYDAGFILHVRAEKQGNASAHFTLGEFSELVERILRESIMDEADVLRQAARLKDIATMRLVFLGDRNEGRIAFDVRSLQEFMAAARIMVSPEPAIKKRLLEIAMKSHWGHVFRIACSKIYAQTSLQAMRSEVLTILDNLDAGDLGDDYFQVQAGARLAIALLEDSTAGASEMDRDRLMNRAVHILGVDCADATEIAGVADRVTRASLERALLMHLEDGGGVGYRNAIRVLLTISRNASHPLMGWAQTMLDDLKKPIVEPRDFLDLALPPNPSPAMKSTFLNVAWGAGPAAMRRWSGRAVELACASAMAPGISDLLNAETRATVVDNGAAISTLSTTFIAITAYANLELEPSIRDSNPSWKVVHATAQFSRSPSKASLAEVIRAAQGISRSELAIADMPWPVATLLSAISNGRSGEDVVCELEEGRHGEASDWLAAEDEWRVTGVQLTALGHPSLTATFLTDHLACPPSRRLSKTASAELDAILTRLMAHFSGLPVFDRLGAVPTLCYLAPPRSASLVLGWIGEDVLGLDWPRATSARVATLCLQALRERENISLVSRFGQKILEAPYVFQPQAAPPAVWEALEDPATACWAASLILTVATTHRQAITEKLRTLDARILAGPLNGNDLCKKKFALLRSLSGCTALGERDEDVDLLASQFLPTACSTDLRRAYSGQRASPHIEGLLTDSTVRALERRLEHREVLLKILVELISSRESRLDDAARLAELDLPADVERTSESDKVTVH